MILLGLLGEAVASPDAWNSLNEAAMIEAAGGTAEAAARVCTAALDTAPADDPTRGELLYCIARNRLRLGDENGALGALRAIPTTSPAWATARGLVDRLQLQAGALPRLPVTCTFDGEQCGFVRAWDGVDKGVLEDRDDGDETVLAWDTVVKEGEEDRIRVAFATDVAPRSVSFRVRATKIASDLRVYLSEGNGLRFVSPILEVETDNWAHITLPVSAFRPVDGMPARVSPRAVRVVDLVDLTGTLRPERGENTLLLDDFEVR